MPIWDFLRTYSPALAAGTLTTCIEFLMATAIAVVVAVAMGLAKLSGRWLIRVPAIVYIEIFRGTSLLVQLYWIFFVLPLFGITLPKSIAGFLSVGLNCGAYGAELVRGAIEAVPRGQWEAATAISLSPGVRMRRIILPQALSVMLPPWGNLLVELLKGTALVALISVSDLMFEVKQINAMTYLSAQAFGTALVIYYLLARFLITPFMRWLEHVASRRLGKV